MSLPYGQTVRCRITQERNLVTAMGNFTYLTRSMYWRFVFRVGSQSVARSISLSPVQRKVELLSGSRSAVVTRQLLRSFVFGCLKMMNVSPVIFCWPSFASHEYFNRRPAASDLSRRRFADRFSSKTEISVTLCPLGKLHQSLVEGQLTDWFKHQ